MSRHLDYRPLQLAITKTAEAAARINWQQAAEAANEALAAVGILEDEPHLTSAQVVVLALETITERLPKPKRLGNHALVTAAAETALTLARTLRRRLEVDDLSSPMPEMVQVADFVANFQAPEYIVDGVIQRGRLYAMTAKTGHGKTAVALCLSAHVAAGRPLGNRHVERGGVVYLAAENPEDSKARVILLQDRWRMTMADLPFHFVAGGFDLPVWQGALAAQIAAIGKTSLVIVDTAPAFLAAGGGDEENDNMAMLRFALVLRELTNLPGNPAVVALTHPVKSAAAQCDLLPRGGGAFLNEIDGNLTLWVEGDREATSLHWAGKIRGPDFEPVTFKLVSGTCPELADAKGRQMPSVVAELADAAHAEQATARQRRDEDDLLLAMDRAHGASMARLADMLGWHLSSGNPHKARVERGLKRLTKERFTINERGNWRLTPKGRDEVKRLLKEAENA